MPGRTVAAKTGTTNDRRDNWTIGWTANQIVAGVWVGNNDNSQMKELSSGISGAAPIWRRIMQASLKNKPNVLFELPGGITTAQVDSVSGYLSHDDFASRQEYFVDTNVPSGEDQIHKKICEGEYFIFKEEDPTGANLWQEGIDSWLATQSDARYHLPANCTTTGETTVNLDFQTPKDNESIESTTFNVKISASGVQKIIQVELELDTTKIATFTNPPFEMSVTTTAGIHTLRAKAKDSKGEERDKKITVNVGKFLSPTPSTTNNP